MFYLFDDMIIWHPLSSSFNNWNNHDGYNYCNNYEGEYGADCPNKEKYDGNKNYVLVIAISKRQ